MEIVPMDSGIVALQTQSLALAEIASELIRGDGVDRPVEDPLPSCQELLDIALSLLMIEPTPLRSSC